MESLSIIIPCYNSENKIEILLPEILKAAAGYNYEIVFINDGSTDNTWAEIKKASELFPEVKGISLKSNSGQQNALFAGICYSSGSYVITMDDDMEHNPEIIPQLINKAEEGFDLVYAVNSKKYSFLRKAGSFVHDLFFYAAFRKPFNLKITSFRVIGKNLIDKIKLTDRHFIYISAIALSFNPEVTCIKIPEVSVSGSRYSIRNLFILFSKLVLNYTFPEPFYSFINNHLFPEKRPAREKILKSVSDLCGEFYI